MGVIGLLLPAFVLFGFLFAVTSFADFGAELVRTFWDALKTAIGLD